jgi:two-component system, cell cycle sensor histidine kinase and response regulator CckA
VTQTLRLLQVEDSESDAAMIVRALTKAGYRVEAERVETAAEMRAALAREHFHLVLADYQLPQFDAPGALAILHESGQDLPFIVVSGMVGEESAVNMMKRGAHDYLMKGSLARLGPAVERELREAQGRRERRSAEQALRDSEERFRAFFLQAPIGVALADLDGRITDVNLAYCRMLGYERDELCRLTLTDLVHADDRPTVHKLYGALAAGSSKGYRGERRLLKKDGGVIWVNATATSITNAGGSVLCGLGMFEDISERRRIAQTNQDLLATLRTVNELAIELTASRSVEQVQAIMAEKLLAITNALAVSVSDYSPQRRELTIARVAVPSRRVGLLSRLGRILGQKVVGFRTPLDDGALKEILKTVVRRYSSLSEVTFGAIPEPVARAAHEAFGIGDLYGMALVERGQLLGTCVLALRRGDPPLAEDLQSALARVCTVAMGRARAVEALIDSEARFSTIFQASPQSIALARIGDHTIVDVNQAWSELTGWSREDAVGRRTADLDIWVDAGQRDEMLRRLREHGVVRGLEVRHRTRAGTEGDLLMSAARLEVASEPYLVTMALDISDRKRAEGALRVSEQRFRSVFESVKDGILLAETKTMRLLMANPAICAMLGYTQEELLQLRVPDLHPAHELAPVREAFREDAGGVHHERLSMKRKDGSLLPAALDATPIVLGGHACFLGVFRDMTAFDDMENQMRQAQKMEAIGQLAGGVAHDFNNILAVILGYAEIVQRRMTTRGMQHGRIEQIRRAAERGANLTRQLLAFSRKQVLEPRVLDLNTLLAGVAPMLRRLIGEDVKLVTSLADDVGPVRADEGQMHQVLMNLAVNARDAMPRGGTLTLATTRELSGAAESGTSSPGPAPYVVLSVRDTGHGMDEETLTHVFEPFFTTKEPGKGTGLGLATVYGVVKQSGGHVEVESEPGCGTTFRICLPEVKGEVEPAQPQPTSAYIKGGSETILLLEDDPALRELEQELLEGAGYRVLVAKQSEEALAAVFDSPDRIDLLLSDVIMPGMSGPELATKLVERRPELKVLYVSGYTADAIEKHGIREPGVRLLQKPFTTEGILRAVRSVLDETGVPSQD